ncbi:hypothetical protein SteCoe_7659 [Stentor coeruleus]|uniref:Uncharacterized protein n=1 Tax=Stentor coeruleus TaxID=5963 RepID=A0A1R2CM90_9CILI|nr:hypothetical protein SteCoe_7659 [Stentor coeruleus]
MKEMYLEICKTLRCTPNSAILNSFQEDPDLFIRDRLSLPQNYLGSKGVRSILLLIYKNSNIHNLSLSGQGIKSDCACDIAEAFEYHSRIHTIDLSNNRIGIKGATALLKLFEKNESIKVIHMEGNPIPKSLLENFQKLIEKKKEVRFFTHYEKMPEEWWSVNIEESGSLAPIFTPTPSQTNLSIRDDFSRVTTYYDPDDYPYKTHSTPFS